MAKCSLRIELPEARDFVEPGGKLDVIVHVECDSKTKCNGLTLTRFWRTHGKGNRDTGDKRIEELFRGEWQPGSYAYPTTIEFPHAPTSYHGKAINIDWYLLAEADVPFAFDPKAEEMVLMADSASPRAYVPPSVWAPQPVKLKTELGGCMIPSSVGLVVAAILLVTGYKLFAALLLLVSLGFLAGSYRARSSLKAIEFAALEIYPAEVAPGEAFQVVLELKPRGSLAIEQIKLTLTATEKATSGSGTRRTVHKEEAFQIDELVAEDVRLVGGEGFDHEVTIQLPVMAPTSFGADSNEIQTTLTLWIQPVKQPALTHTAILPVISGSTRD